MKTLFLALLIWLWLAPAAFGGAIAVRDDNKQMWIDLLAFADTNDWNIQWDVPSRKIQLSQGEKQISWYVGVPWVMTAKGPRKIESFPRYDDSVLWAPLNSTLELTAQWLGSHWEWNAQGRLIKGKTTTSTSSSTSSSSKISSSSSIAENQTGSIKTIIIDPGHGGKDPGAIGPYGAEKDVVLAVGLKLRQKLQRKGFDVRMTRENDTFIELQDRPAMATKWKGDLFISLHCDAVDGEERRKKAEGFKVYILREAESEEDKAIARRENKAAELSAHKRKAEITPLEWIVLENQLNAYTKFSESFAAKLVDEYEAGEIRKTGSGAGQAGFMVLVGAFMPAVLVELGFISHPEDGKYLTSPKGQEDIAERLAKAIIRFSKAEP